MFWNHLFLQPLLIHLNPSRAFDPFFYSFICGRSGTCSNFLWIFLILNHSTVHHSNLSCQTILCFYKVQHYSMRQDCLHSCTPAATQNWLHGSQSASKLIKSLCVLGNYYKLVNTKTRVLKVMARKDHPDAHTRLVISRIISLTTGPELVPSIAWEDQTVKQPVSVYRPLYCRFAWNE